MGKKYECPFCNGKFATFLSAGGEFSVLSEKQIVGAGIRLHSTCPRCLSSDRERLVYLYLFKEKKYILCDTLKLLHVAPEYNLAIKLKSNSKMHYLSADLNASLADTQMDITNIQEHDETYDVIICNHVLEHIPDDLQAMSELYRVLKKGGFAILQVPISLILEKTFEDPSVSTSEERESVFGHKEHVRIYGNDYRLRLEKAGFSVTAHPLTDYLGSVDVARFGLNKKEKIFVCSKL
ncbi:MAG: methyltransferase domain-containing protein [Thermodesulfobacteriota bacterium]|nr:methyltransferase domain-containing protein [Thermodesulfobacteriota bacterium]